MFTLSIKTDNAAFGETQAECRTELARILRQVADGVEHGRVSAPHDINGNVVGHYRVSWPKWGRDL